MHAPIFILGLQRSGTTLLYEMLAASGAFRISTAWHVICFDELLTDEMDPTASRERLRDRFAAAGLKTRGVDIVATGPDTPEEYGFVLANRGLGLSIHRRNFSVFERYCDVVARYGRNGDRVGPLLLKNTWDFGNAGRIRALIPGARFIFIHRNPFPICSSLFRVVCSAVDKGFPYLAMLSNRYRNFANGGVLLKMARLFCSRCPGLLATGVVRFLAHQAHQYTRSLDGLPAESRMHVQYETLCAEPNEVMDRLLAFALNSRPVPRPAARDYRAMIGPHATKIDAQIQKRAGLIQRCFESYAASAGYDLKLPAHFSS